MKMMFMTTIMILMILVILIILLNTISKKSFSDREKSSPFECGFDPKNPARLPFSLQFFLIGVIFLIFDVEITLLLPSIMTMTLSNLLDYASLITTFIMVLLMGIYHEWNQGALDWAK